MSTFALEVQGCSRRFRSRKGTVQALQDVSFQVPEGACCGLLGPNGAGKSTLIRILANVLRPDAAGSTCWANRFGGEGMPTSDRWASCSKTWR